MPKRDHSSDRPVIGVLALQGCVTPHRAHIEAAGATFKEVRTEDELKHVDGLILPGGESTTMLKLIDLFRLEPVLRETFERVPVWGICAGAILMARHVTSPEQRSFGILDCEIERNAFGRQLESFNTDVAGYPVSFIRAPRIRTAGPGVRIRAEYEREPVWVEGAKHMATTFHPELTTATPSPMHQEFVKRIRELRAAR